MAGEEIQLRRLPPVPSRAGLGVDGHSALPDARMERPIAAEAAHRGGARQSRRLSKFLSNPAMSETDTDRDGVSRQVASAFPRAHVELWAVHEHRIGLKPTIRKAWTLGTNRPLAPSPAPLRVALSGPLVHPASGRTVFQLASTVSIALFKVELAAFARAVGSWPAQANCPRLGSAAGWHSRRGCACPSMSTYSFSRPIPLSCSLPSISGR